MNFPQYKSVILRSVPLFLAAFVVAISPGYAAEPKVVDQHSREFRIIVDGKQRGNQTMTISRHSDDTEVMRGEAEVVVNVLVYRYRYASVGSETWKDGKLIELTNEADFNGDKYVLKGAATKQSLDYQVNGNSKRAPVDIWAASYWREPTTSRVGQSIRVLDTDKGRLLTTKLERLGTESLTADSKPIKATHYRIRGDVEVDVWYDEHGLIIRQESVESGHRTVLELLKIRHPQVATR